jgi:fructoselysine 6-kinase
MINVAFFGGTPDMADDLSRLAMGRKGIVVLTLGAEGSKAFVNDQVYRQTALPVDKVIDTTGCGDAFQAAFNYEYYKSRNVIKALQAGAELGRLATQTHGGVPWLSK